MEGGAGEIRIPRRSVGRERPRSPRVEAPSRKLQNLAQTLHRRRDVHGGTLVVPPGEDSRAGREQSAPRSNLHRERLHRLVGVLLEGFRPGVRQFRVLRSRGVGEHPQRVLALVRRQRHRRRARRPRRGFLRVGEEQGRERVEELRRVPALELLPRPGDDRVQTDVRQRRARRRRGERRRVLLRVAARLPRRQRRRLRRRARVRGSLEMALREYDRALRRREVPRDEVVLRQRPRVVLRRRRRRRREVPPRLRGEVRRGQTLRRRLRRRRRRLGKHRPRDPEARAPPAVERRLVRRLRRAARARRRVRDAEVHARLRVARARPL